MPPVLVVGTVAYDSVETPLGHVDEVLGGSATYFSVAASFFTRVDLVACVGKDFIKHDLQIFKDRNVDLEGLQQLEGRTFRWKGKYGYDLNDAETLETNLNVLADFQPSIPQSYQSNDYVFLGNIDPSLQKDVITQVRNPKLVACDTMNYWISADFETLLKTLQHVDILIINDAEMRQLTQEASLVKGARKVHMWGPRTLVVKRGEYGVLMFQKERENAENKQDISVFGVPAYPLEEVFDPTGAGDSFAGGFLGYLAGIDRFDPPAIRQAIVFGSVMASFNVEKFSLGRLKELTHAEILLRYRQFKEMTHFENKETLNAD